MRIIYLHQYFNTPEMPGGTRSYEMARRLVAAGHEVEMVTSRRSDASAGWTETDEAGIRVHWCGVPYSNEMSYRRRIRAFAKFSWLAARKAVELPGDVIFATSTPLTIALPAVWASRRKSIPMVFEVRDLWPEMPIAVGALRSRPLIAAARWLERFAYRNAAHVVALSPGMKEGVVAAGCPADRVTVIPNSCDLDLFRVDPSAGEAYRREFDCLGDWLGDRPLVVYAGTLGYVNGVDYLARLAAVVRHLDPEIRFLVVGSGREEERIRREAGNLGVLDETFFMMPPVAKEQMPAILSAADVATSVFLDVPEMWANSANKAFDALAAGRPLAINHGGWLAETIEQEGCGLVLSPRDLESSAERLVASIHDPLWLARAGRAAGRVGQERFSRDKLAGMLESVLTRVVGGEQRRKAA